METYNMKPIVDLMGKNIKKMNDILGVKTYECPYCDYVMLDESEAESAVDCGCPSCRRIIDWEEPEYPRYPKDLK